MPDLTFMAWNIETFGDQTRPRGNYVALCNFIAHVVHNVGAAILAIMELRNSGTAYLNALAAALDNICGGTWYYDWIKGAVDTNPPANATHLKWDADHHEGYAVFWNDARNGDFRLFQTRGQYSNGVSRVAGGAHPGRIPGHILNLVREGRNQGNLQNIGNNHYWFTAPAFDPNNPNLGNPLNFSVSNPLNIGDVRADGPRRPCYFVVQLNRAAPHNNAQNRLLPILVYHATSNPRSRRLNTQLAGYSRPLYQVDSTPAGLAPTWTNVNNAIIAGDFNVDANNANAFDAGGLAQRAYTVFTNSFANFGAGCNALLQAAPTVARTTVRLRRSNHQQIQGNAVNDFLGLAIDNIFYRLGPNVNLVAPGAATYPDRYDLLTNVMTGELIDNNIPDAISDFWTVLSNQLGPLKADGNYTNYPNREPNSQTPTNFSGTIIGDLENWKYFRLGLDLGEFHEVAARNNTNSDARAAAEFIFKTISDHLPVVIRINFT